MANKLTPEQIKMLLANMPSLKESRTEIAEDNTGKKKLKKIPLKNKKLEDAIYSYIQNKQDTYTGPSIGKYNEGAHNPNVAAERAIQAYKENSDLAKTMGSFTPSGDSKIGAIGAETVANMTPMGSGQLLAAKRLASIFNNPKDNEYVNESKGTFDNALGAINLLGDLGMIGSTLKTSSVVPKSSKILSKKGVELLSELVQKNLFKNKIASAKNIPEDVRALADANRDALTFSNSPYNKAKMQAFRPGQTFDITNTEAMFPDNPKALELLNKIKKDNPQDFGHETIESLVGEKGDEGRYLARNLGDLEDLAVVRRGDDYRKVYDATVHELGHSRSIRNASTPEERKILNDAWSELNTDEVLEQEPVQHELRMRLGDKLGNRIYTEKDIPEIKSIMQDFEKRKHPYVKDANKFNYDAIVNSLNKIGAAAVVGATTKKLLSDKTVETLKKKKNG